MRVAISTLEAPGYDAEGLSAEFCNAFGNGRWRFGAHVFVTVHERDVGIVRSLNDFDEVGVEEEAGTIDARELDQSRAPNAMSD
jgi:hypothetical protein